MEFILQKGREKQLQNNIFSLRLSLLIAGKKGCRSFRIQSKWSRAKPFAIISCDMKYNMWWVLLILAATFRMYLSLNCEGKLKGTCKIPWGWNITLSCCSKSVRQVDRYKSSSLQEEVQVGRRSGICTKMNFANHNLESKGGYMQDQETHERQFINTLSEKKIIPGFLMDWITQANLKTCPLTMLLWCLGSNLLLHMDFLDYISCKPITNNIFFQIKLSDSTNAQKSNYRQPMTSEME